MNTDNELLKNLNKLHTTESGIKRIKRNLSLDTDNVADWCRLIRAVIRSLRHIRKRNEI